MGNKIPPPLFLIVTVIIGLFCLFWLTSSLNKLTLTRPDAMIYTTDEASFPVVEYRKSLNGSADTIIMNSNFLESLDRQQRESMLNLLPQIPDMGFLNLNPEVFRWIFFTSLVISIFVSTVPYIFLLVLSIFRKTKKYFNRYDIAGLSIALVSVIISLYLVNKPQIKLIGGDELMSYFNIIFSDPIRAINFVIYPLFFVALIPILGIMLCNFRTYFTFYENRQGALSKSDDDKAEAYGDIKTHLNIFALFSGLLVSCSVLALGLARTMIADQIGDDLFPLEIVYANGITNSFILALFFIPSFVYLRYSGREFHGKVKPTGEGSLWSIGQDTIDNLKIALSVSLPLISSLIQPFLAVF